MEMSENEILFQHIVQTSVILPIEACLLVLDVFCSFDQFLNCHPPSTHQPLLLLFSA